jgi:hypothetical protein
LKIGDVLLSPIANNKEIVASIDTFQSQNYMVIPRYCNSSFVINEHQTLPIFHGNRYINVSLPTYEKLSNKNDIFLVHEATEFQYTAIGLDPYIFGVWFSHYAKNPTFEMILPKSNITTIFYIQSFLEKFNIKHIECDDYVVITDARLLKYMEKYGFLFDTDEAPVIPNVYKYNMKSIRAKFLQGFIDSTDTTEVAIGNKTLKDDILFIAHSLGLLTATKYKNKMWYVTVIYNDAEMTVERKNDFKIAKIPNMDALCVGIIGTTSPAIFLADFTVI